MSRGREKGCPEHPFGCGDNHNRATEMPPNPFSELAMASSSLNELYLSYRTAGFAPHQAMYLVGCLLTGSPGPAPGDMPPDPNG